MAVKTGARWLTSLVAIVSMLTILIVMSTSTGFANSGLGSSNSQETIPKEMPPGTIITYDQNNQMIVEKPDYNSLFKEKQPLMTKPMISEEEKKKIDAEERKILEEIE